MSLAGYDAGVVAGFLWSSFFDLEGLIALSAVLALVSGVLVLKFIPEPKLFFERKAMLFSREVFTHWLRALPIVIFKFPTWPDLRRFARMLRLTIFREVPTLYFSVFILNLGTNIFGTSYVPALKQNQITDNVIFLITLANTVTQTAVYLYIHRNRFFERHGVVDTTKLILGARFGTMLITGISIALFQGNMLIAFNLMTYAALGADWAFYNTAVSTLIFRTLNPQKQGETLGIYSALGGLFSFMGAIISGYLSYSLGFFVTFSTAAVLMIISRLLLDLSAKIGGRVKLLHDIVTYGQTKKA